MCKNTLIFTKKSKPLYLYLPIDQRPAAIGGCSIRVYFVSEYKLWAGLTCWVPALSAGPQREFDAVQFQHTAASGNGSLRHRPRSERAPYQRPRAPWRCPTAPPAAPQRHHRSSRCSRPGNGDQRIPRLTAGTLPHRSLSNYIQRNAWNVPLESSCGNYDGCVLCNS